MRLRHPLHRRTRTRTFPGWLWYPGGAALRERAVASCPDHLSASVGPLDEPVPGVVTLRHDEWGWETGFHTAGGLLVPAGIPGGGLFVTHVVAPQNLLVHAQEGVDVLAWLSVEPDVHPRDRFRLEQAGWRLGRPR